MTRRMLIERFEQLELVAFTAVAIAWRVYLCTCTRIRYVEIYPSQK